MAIFRVLLNPPFVVLMGDWRKIRSQWRPNFSYTYWANFFNRRLHGAIVYLWAESLLPAAPWGSLSALHRNPLGVDGVVKNRAPEFRRESISYKKSYFRRRSAVCFIFWQKPPSLPQSQKQKQKMGPKKPPAPPKNQDIESNVHGRTSGLSPT